jgi:hypothetical protein
VDIDAHATAIDLARSQLDQPYRSGWHAALFGNCVEIAQSFHDVGKDDGGIIYSWFHVYRFLQTINSAS